MICARCGDEYPNTLPSPFALVTLSGPGGGTTWNFCVARCAAVVAAWLSHTWELGQEPTSVPLTANGELALGDDDVPA